MSKGPGTIQRRILDAVEANPAVPGWLPPSMTAEEVRDSLRSKCESKAQERLLEIFSDDQLIHFRDKGAKPPPWLTITDIFGESLTASQRESARRAMRRLADAGRVAIGLVERNVPINRRGYRYIDGEWQRTEMSQDRREVTAVRACGTEPG